MQILSYLVKTRLWLLQVPNSITHIILLVKALISEIEMLWQLSTMEYFVTLWFDVFYVNILIFLNKFHCDHGFSGIHMYFIEALYGYPQVFQLPMLQVYFQLWNCIILSHLYLCLLTWIISLIKIHFLMMWKNNMRFNFDIFNKWIVSWILILNLMNLVSNGALVWKLRK